MLVLVKQYHCRLLLITLPKLPKQKLMQKKQRTKRNSQSHQNKTVKIRKRKKNKRNCNLDNKIIQKLLTTSVTRKLRESTHRRGAWGLNSKIENSAQNHTPWGSSDASSVDPLWICHVARMPGSHMGGPLGHPQ